MHLTVQNATKQNNNLMNLTQSVSLIHEVTNYKKLSSDRPSESMTDLLHSSEKAEEYFRSGVELYVVCTQTVLRQVLRRRHTRRSQQLLSAFCTSMLLHRPRKNRPFLFFWEKLRQNCTNFPNFFHC